jgi:ankyrin repeat protein
VSSLAAVKRATQFLRGVGVHGTALHAACEFGRPDIAQILLEHGADANILGEFFGCCEM